MRVAALLFLTLVLAFTGCTSRGGWPRFLRPGEKSDAEMKRYFQTNQPSVVHSNYGGVLLLKSSSVTPPQVNRIQSVPPIPHRTNAYCTNGYQYSWSYSGTAPEFARFRLEASDGLSQPWKPWATNSAPVFNWYRTNGPNKFLRCVAMDADLPKDSLGRPK